MRHAGAWMAAALLAAGVGGAAGAAEAEPRELGTLRVKYERQVDAAVGPILQNYIRELEGLLGQVTQKRDFGGARHVQDEMIRQKERLAGLPKEAWLGEPPPAAASSENPIVNPGFEKGTEGWFMLNTDAARTKADRGAAEAHSGHGFLRFKRDDRTDTGVALQDVSAIARPGRVLRITGWTRRAKGARGQAVFGVALKDAAGKKTLQTAIQTVRATGAWEEISIDLAVPTRDQAPEYAVAHLFLAVLEPGPTDEVLLDDVALLPAGP